MKKLKKKKKYTEKQKNEARRIIGSLGGQATFKKLGKRGMSKLGKLAAKARWGK